MLIQFISFIQPKPASCCSGPFPVVLLIAALVHTSLISTTQAASYIEPDHTTELFQLEEIPLPQHRSQQLGKSLAIIAQRKHDASPANQLASARLLMLAMQLDPKNKRPYEISKALSLGKVSPATPQHLITQCLNDAQETQSLLSQPRAGAQANQLARLIKDACKTMQPKTNGDEDTADWKDILPSIAAYRAAEKVTAPKQVSLPTKPAPRTQVKKPALASPKKRDLSQKAKSQFHLTTQFILLPINIKNEDSDLIDVFDDETTAEEEPIVVQLARISLSLKPSDSKKDNTPFIKLAYTNTQDPELDSKLIKILTNKYSIVPSSQGLVKFTNGSFNRKQPISLTAPLALMLNASLANRPLKDGLCILADIDDKGKVIEPENFWSSLSTLRNSSDGGRLIVSTQSLEIMKQLLVFKEPDFFTHWEVLSVSNIEEALEAAVVKSNEQFQQAGEIFSAIQKLGIDKNVAQLAADHAIRSKLEETLALNPSHLSAETLLLQGSGNRPIHLDTTTFRLVLQPLAEELNSALKNTSGKDNIQSLKKSHDELRAKLDKLEPIVDRDDQELFEDAIDLTSDLDKLATLKERIAKRSNNEATKQKAEKLLEEMQRNGVSLIERLMAIDQIDKDS
ncbi:MAG: hypothetical protein P8P36_03865 [Akkermansiaceae bacterium]|nr:hypothetical protein [Akkermansiaceae bacterium]